MSLTEFDQEQYERQIRAEGFEDGFNDGHNEGISQGEQKAKLEAAKNLIQMKVLSFEQIAQAQGLPLEEVKALSETLEVKNTK